MAALAADQAVIATQLGGAATESGAPASSASPTPSPSPSASAAGGTPVKLPASISGQAADQSTCSTGRSG
jgi:hypothetical protein